jgi:hypothetical protein
MSNTQNNSQQSSNNKNIANQATSRKKPINNGIPPKRDN